MGILSYPDMPSAAIPDNVRDIQRREREKPQYERERQTQQQVKGAEDRLARPREAVKVNRVIDGDTIEVKIGDNLSRVRLIGIDCPEASQEYGKEATEFTRSFLSFGNAELEFDVQLKDRYGRLLAYVWYRDEMLNSLLVKSGLAVVTTYPPNIRYVDLFKKLQETARLYKEGIWKFGGLEKTPFEFRKGGNNLL